MFQLHDLRKSKVWQEAHEEGRAEGREEGREKGREEGREKGREEGKALAQAELVRKCLANGMSAKEIAKLMEISVAQVRRLAKQLER